MTIQDMLSTGVGVLLVLKVEELVGNMDLTCWRNRTTPIAAFGDGFYDARKRRHVSNSDLSRHQVWSNGTDIVLNGKAPQHAPFRLLLVSSKILRFRRIFLKCDNEPSAKSFHDAVIHACVGVEVIPQGPPEG